MAKTAYFSKETFRFFSDLKRNNDRDWFNANKLRYEQHVKAPFLSFIGDFAGPLEKISPHFVADPRPSGGSLFRIYRDVRFSKNKDPYKTQAGAQFRHELGKDVHTPGYYFHVEPGGCFAGCGIWHPDGETLRKIRDRIVERPDDWRAVISSKPIASGKLELVGDSLTRAPKGYDQDHPLAVDLKRKDFITVTNLSDDEVLGDDIIDRFAAICRDAAPLMRFLCAAVGAPY